MKFTEYSLEINYFADTDTLRLTFNSNPVVATEDLGENLLVDFDQQGNPVALTIEHAQTFTDVHKFSFQHIAQVLNRSSVA